MGLMYTCTYMYVLLVYVYRGYNDLISNRIQASSVLLPLFSRDTEFLSLRLIRNKKRNWLIEAWHNGLPVYVFQMASDSHA